MEGEKRCAEAPKIQNEDKRSMLGLLQDTNYPALSRYTTSGPPLPKFCPTPVIAPMVGKADILSSESALGQERPIFLGPKVP